MKLSIIAVIVAAGLPSLTSAWELWLYREPGYQVPIEHQNELYSHDCVDLHPQLRGKTQSMKWDGEDVFGQCTVHLYLHIDCSIPIVVKTQNTNIPNMKTVGEDDAVSSWKVICNENIG